MLRARDHQRSFYENLRVWCWQIRQLHRHPSPTPAHFASHRTDPVTWSDDLLKLFFIKPGNGAGRDDDLRGAEIFALGVVYGAELQTQSTPSLHHRVLHAIEVVEPVRYPSARDREPAFLQPQRSYLSGLRRAALVAPPRFAMDRVEPQRVFRPWPAPGATDKDFNIRAHPSPNA